MNCGYPDPYHSMKDCAPCAEKEEKKDEGPKIIYPSFSLCGDIAKAIMRRKGVDEEITLTIKAKIIAQSDRGESSQAFYSEKGCRVELEVHDCSGEGLSAKDAEEPEEDAKSAFAKYRKEKGKTGSED